MAILDSGESISQDEALANLQQLAEVFLQTAPRPASERIELHDEAGPPVPATILVDELGNVHGFSAEAERLFGRTTAEVLGTSIASLLGAVAANASRPAGMRVKLHDGTEVSLWVTSSRLALKDASYVALTFHEQDVAGGRRTELRYRHLVEQIPAVVFTAALDAGLYDIYVSPQVQNLLGYSQAEWVSNPVLWYERLHPDDRRKLDEEFARGCATGGPFRAECRFLTKDDRIVWVHGEARLIKDAHGFPLLLQGVAFDITDTKRAEETVRASLREKETLLKEIHHRVKNNLQVTSSLLKLQSDEVADPAARKALRESQDRIRSMALVHELLYQSKDLSRVDMGAYVRDLTRQLMRSLGSDVFRIKTDLNVQSVFFSVDLAVPCGLILNELISNALKHAFPEGRPGTVRIALSERATGIELLVKDDGVGMPRDADLRTGKTLGLRLIKTLADQVEGSIDVRSDSGGTEVRLALPRRGEPT